MRTTTKLHAIHAARGASSKRPVKIGIRAEDPQRIWERRAPLTPDAVYALVSEGRATVDVVSSAKRIFSDQEYRKAGARIVTHLLPAETDIFLSIKEPPLSSSSSSLSPSSLFPSPSPSSSRSTPPSSRYALPYGASLPPPTQRPRPSARRSEPATHLMFSHTIKGQPYNMPLLAQFVAPSASSSSSAASSLPSPSSRSASLAHTPASWDPPRLDKSLAPRLVDYELITGGDGKRTVGFGWFAGVAGVLESLSSMAQAHLELGIASPFLYTPRPHTLPSLDRLRAALREIGQTIAGHGTPAELGPFVVGLTGTGQVAEGCLSMLSELPIEMVKVQDLERLMHRARSSEVDLRKIYLVHAKPADYFVRVDGAPYERAHYYASPHSYTSVFHERVAPYLTLFLNGAGWAPAFPRLMTTRQLEVALSAAQALGGARCTNVGDISCDVEGGLEFLDQATTLSSPARTVRTSQPSLPPVRMMAVDILPAAIPYDASVHFSGALMSDDGGCFRGLVAYHAGERARVPEVLERATVAVDGRLAKGREWLLSGVDKVYEERRAAGAAAPCAEAEGTAGTRDAVAAAARAAVAPTASPSPQRSAGAKKRILMLGSGMVAAPAVDLIAQSSDVDLVVAGDSALELERLVGPHHHVQYRIINAAKPATYSQLVKDADVVISLLPVMFHSAVAEVCLEQETHLITASYTSESMESLNEEAREKGLLFLTEMGLDPGIDHCSAMELLDKFERQGKRVLSFTSFCGGLPMPEDAHVPLGYKFSWRPQGVLTAALNSAAYLLNGKVHRVPGDRLLQSYWPDVPITRKFKLEGLPNRDSLAYKNHYGITSPERRTIVRGTLRYPGFSALMSSFAALGLLDTTHHIRIAAWPDLIAQCLSHKRELRGADISLSSLIPPQHVDALHDALEWLGLAKPRMMSAVTAVPMPPVPDAPITPLDAFAYLLAQRLRYMPGERDMVVLSHEIITRGPESASALGPSGTQGVTHPVEIHTSTLITHGVLTPDVGAVGLRPASAMARTVGLPAAIAALLVARGRIREAGVMRPTGRAVYAPVLEELRRVGVGMEEHVRLRVEGVESGRGVGGARTVEDALVAAEHERWAAGKANVKAEASGLGGGAVVKERDLDDDHNWTEEGLVVDPSKQF